MKSTNSKLYSHRINYFLILCMIFLSCKDSNQPPVHNEKDRRSTTKSTVILTYDDALDVHLDNVLPLLDALDLKATFYINTGAESVSNRRSEWKEAAKSGHELGNHTVHHPCIGMSLNREWVSKENDLDLYTVDKLVDEIKEANDTLHAVDGLTRRTYAYTCGDTTAADQQSYVSHLNALFPSARGVYRGNNKLDSLDLYQLKAFSIAGHSFSDIQPVIDKNHEQEGLLIFLLHGVGGGHSLNMELEEHQKMIEYLYGKKDEILITTMIEMTDFITAIE